MESKSTIKLARAAATGFAIVSIRAAGNVLAYHSSAASNMNERVVLNGTIRRFDWQSPHA
jgi:Family of unknown function (DUF6152)